MNKNRLLMGSVILVVIGVLAAAGIGYWVLGPTKPASGPLQAIPLDLTPAAPAATSTPGQAPTAPAAASTAAATAAPAATSAPPADVVVLEISQAESQAGFTISEVLRGSPKEVLGTTDQVAGQIAVNPTDLAASRVGTIQVNARTLVTDEEGRNRAIRNRILNTDIYEFVTFTPAQITGLSGSGALNQPFMFQITGDLTIRDVTRPVTFDVTVLAESTARLTGTATATINRADYGLVIPSVPFVANVGEQVTLTLTFVATPAEM